MTAAENPCALCIMKPAADSANPAQQKILTHIEKNLKQKIKKRSIRIPLSKQMPKVRQSAKLYRRGDWIEPDRLRELEAIEQFKKENYQP